MAAPGISKIPLLEEIKSADHQFIRTVENPMKRVILAWGMIAVHLVLIIIISIFLLICVDGVKVNADNHRYSDGRTLLIASDITTAVSMAMLLMRVVTGSWTTTAAWRSAYILLEKDSLSLNDINYLVSYKLPPLKSSLYGQLTMTVILLMLPAQFCGPLAAGAVSWQSGTVYQGGYNITVESVIGKQGERGDAWEKYLTSPVYRGILANKAFSNSFMLYVAGEKPAGTATGCRRHVNSPLVVGSTVTNITIPRLEVHSIKWDPIPNPKLLDSPSNSIEDDASAPVNNIRVQTGGNIAFLDLPPWGGAQRYWSGSAYLFPNASFFSGARKVAFIYQCVSKVCNTTELGVLSQAEPPGVYVPPTGAACYIFGTVNFTAGTASHTGTFVSPGVVDLDPGAVIGATPLTEETIHLMNDVLYRMITSPPKSRSIPINDHVEQLLRRAFVATWTALQTDFRARPESHPVMESSAASRLVEILQAVVNPWRVFSWLAANLLLTLSGTILILLQRQCRRPVVVDVAAAAIMLDVDQILEKDERGLANISFITKEDRKIGDFVLTQNKQDGLFALVTKEHN